MAALILRGEQNGNRFEVLPRNRHQEKSMIAANGALHEGVGWEIRKALPRTTKTVKTSES
jgi:hypothetical protein